MSGLDFHLYLGGLHSAYVRGEAFLEARQYSDAAAEFQKILNHRGIVGVDPLGALAHMQLGQSIRLIGRQDQGEGCLPGFPHALEGRRHRHPNSGASSRRICQVELS